MADGQSQGPRTAQAQPLSGSLPQTASIQIELGNAPSSAQRSTAAPQQERWGAPGIGKARGISLLGLTGHLVEVEASIAASLPGFVIVGLPDAALGEARDRVRAAVTNSGISWPARKIVVNLSPAHLPKAGTGFDIAIAAAVLAADRRVDPEHVAHYVHIGELGLDGEVRPTIGVLPAVAASVAGGQRDVVVPFHNEREASLVAGARINPVSSIAELATFHGATGVPQRQQMPIPPVSLRGQSSPQSDFGDLADVVGQEGPRLALEIAAAGAHHLLMVGEPGSGKTMLAHRLPTILPELTAEQSLEVTAIHSLVGDHNLEDGLIRRPPFESPHHTATAPAIVGGGQRIRPGAASRAHHGVLFLDEAPEFSPRVLQALRQPLESGQLVVDRARMTVTFPARFQLVMAANPCPCGGSGGDRGECVCPSVSRRRYLQRLSGPLLDRIDLHVQVHNLSRAERNLADPSSEGETSQAVAARVANARRAQRARLATTPWRTNAEVPGSWMRRHLSLGQKLTRELDSAIERGFLTLRGYDRCQRVAWTIADLAGAAVPSHEHVGLALGLRMGSAL